MGTSTPTVDSTYNYSEMVDDLNNAAGNVGGQDTDINNRSDVLERGLIDMMDINGLEAGDPSAVRFAPSQREPDTFFIDLDGVPQEQVDALVNAINEKYGAGTVRDTGAFEGFDTSLQFDIQTTMDKIIPDLDNHLDTLATENPDLIREFQVQSGQSPRFQGPNEEREPPAVESPGKLGFGDITPMIEARQAAEMAGVGGLADTLEIAAAAGVGGVERSNSNQIG